MEEEELPKVDTTILDMQDAELNITCRLCANPNERIIGIYSEEGVSNSLSTKMNLYLPIKVSESDTLPLQCCWSCASTVLAWHELVVASVEADKRLRALEEASVKGDGDFADDGSQELDFDDERSESKSASLSVFHQESPRHSADARAVKKEEWLGCEDDECADALSDQKRGRGRRKRLDPSEFSFSCQFCPMMFVSEPDILAHVKDEHSEPEDEDGTEEEEEEVVGGGRTARRRKKDRRKNTKLDRSTVNAAKVVVEGRIYYNCKVCGKSLHSPYTYIWHMRIHTGERPFVCDLCGKQFRVSQGLVRHLRETHEGIKNFGCDICGRMFATRRNVEEHRRIHTNERPYVCDLCGKSFKQKASLFVHNRSHTDTFPFRCSYCDQGFRTRPPLLIHVTRHTGEKPYPCDVCGRCFRIKYELKRHKLIHSEEKPFACTECGLTFRQKRYLRNHNKINHNRNAAV